MRNKYEQLFKLLFFPFPLFRTLEGTKERCARESVCVCVDVIFVSLPTATSPRVLFHRRELGEKCGTHTHGPVCILLPLPEVKQNSYFQQQSPKLFLLTVKKRIRRKDMLSLYVLLLSTIF